jgi:putative flippase GtrA
MQLKEKNLDINEGRMVFAPNNQGKIGMKSKNSKEILFYVTFSILSKITNILSFLLFQMIFQTLSVSVIASNISSSTLNIFLNSKTFKKKFELSKSSLVKGTVYLILASIIEYLIIQALIKISEEMNYAYLKLISIILFAPLSFLANKYWVHSQFGPIARVRH